MTEHQSSHSSRKWVVMISSFCSFFLGTGVSYSSGVYYVAFLDHYRQDAVVTAWLGSLYSSMFALAGPLASLSINFFDCRTCVMAGSLLFLMGFTISSFVTDIRWLFLTYAFLPGLGEGMVYLASQVVVSFYFPKQLSLVVGTGLAGVGMGVFVFPPLTQFLLDQFGLRGCFLLTGSLSFHTAIFGALMKPCDSEIATAKTKRSEKSFCRRIRICLVGDTDHVKELLKPSFLLLLFSSFCFSIGNYITYLFLPDFLIQQNSPRPEAALLLSVVGVAGAVSRLSAGMAANRTNIGPMIPFVATLGLAGILDFCITPLTTTLGGKAAYSLLFGLFASAAWTLLSPITIQISGVRNFTSALGLVMFACGLGILTGPPLSRFLVNMQGEYQTAFFFAGASFCSAGVCGLLIIFIMRNKKNEEVNMEVKLKEDVDGQAKTKVDVDVNVDVDLECVVEKKSEKVEMEMKDGLEMKAKTKANVDVEVKKSKKVEVEKKAAVEGEASTNLDVEVGVEENLEKMLKDDVARKMRTKGDVNMDVALEVEKKPEKKLELKEEAAVESGGKVNVDMEIGEKSGNEVESKVKVKAGLERKTKVMAENGVESKVEVKAGLARKTEEMAENGVESKVEVKAGLARKTEEMAENGVKVKVEGCVKVDVDFQTFHATIPKTDEMVRL